MSENKTKELNLEDFMRFGELIALMILTSLACNFIVQAQGDINFKLFFALVPAFFIVFRLIVSWGRYDPAKRMKELEEHTDWDT